MQPQQEPARTHEQMCVGCIYGEHTSCFLAFLALLVLSPVCSSDTALRVLCSATQAWWSVIHQDTEFFLARAEASLRQEVFALASSFPDGGHLKQHIDRLGFECNVQQQPAGTAVGLCHILCAALCA